MVVNGAWTRKRLYGLVLQEDAFCLLYGKHGTEWKRLHDSQEWTHVRSAIPWCGVELGEEGMQQLVAGVLLVHTRKEE